MSQRKTQRAQRERKEVALCVLAMVERVGKENLLEELRRESYGQGGKGLWLEGRGELLIRQLLLL
jgi:hypothetical protein